MKISEMTPDQILAWAKGGAFSGVDGSTGGGSPLGYQDPGLNYLGDQQGSLVNSQTQPFGLKIVNSKNADRSFYLSAGYDATIKGALQNGTFAAINDTGSDTSLTASATINGQTIGQLIAYARNQTNGVFIPQIKFTATDAEAFLSTFITFQDQDNPLYALIPRNVPVQDYVNNLSDEYNTQYVTVRDEFYISQCNLISITVPASSTLYMNMSLAVAYEGFKVLKNKVLNAAAFALGNPGATQVVSAAQDMKRLADKGVVSASSLKLPIPSVATR